MRHPRGDVERFFAGGLSTEAAERLRVHLRGCPSCRELYDEHARILRALAGRRDEPTEEELDRVARRALSALGLAAPGDATASVPTIPRVAPSPASSLRWRPLALGGLGAALALALVVVGVGTSRPSPVRVGRLAQAEQASVDGAPAPRGTAIFEGQRLTVAPDGMAVVELDGLEGRPGEARALVRAFPGTEATVEGAGTRLSLQRGKVWCDVDERRAPRPFSVQTAEGGAFVLGTSFVVERKSERTEVRVVKGTVEVRDRQGAGAVRVAARQRTVLAKGEPPAAPVSYAPRDDVEGWRKVLGRFFDELKNAFESGVRQIEDALR